LYEKKCATKRHYVNTLNSKIVEQSFSYRTEHNYSLIMSSFTWYSNWPTSLKNADFFTCCCNEPLWPMTALTHDVRSENSAQPCRTTVQRNTVIFGRRHLTLHHKQTSSRQLTIKLEFVHNCW